MQGGTRLASKTAANQKERGLAPERPPHLGSPYLDTGDGLCAVTTTAVQNRMAPDKDMVIGLEKDAQAPFSSSKTDLSLVLEETALVLAVLHTTGLFVCWILHHFCKRPLQITA